MFKLTNQNLQAQEKIDPVDGPRALEDGPTGGSVQGEVLEDLSGAVTAADQHPPRRCAESVSTGPPASCWTRL